MLSHLFEMVEGHCYWVTYVWAKNATFGKPVIGVLSSGSYLELFERVVVIIVGRISAANSYRT